MIRDKNDPDAQPIGDATGRWMSPDPLSEEFPSYSPYTFVFNNPLRFVDPDGRAPDDIVFRGTDNKELRVKTAGADKVYNVPFALKSNTTVDVGLGNVDSNRFAVGYTVQADAGAAAAFGLGVGVDLSTIQFSDQKYGDYNYVYAGVHENFSFGAQANISASVGGSVSIAYNTDNKPFNPASYEGISFSKGVSADAKFLVGGGVSINSFSSGGKTGWRGFSAGFNVGVGAGGNFGSGNASLGKTILLNDIKPTSERSFLDRTFNTASPFGSALTTGAIGRINN